MGDAWEFYRGKNILAPMVRVNTLPVRMLAAEYGADIVYSEELIDRKMMSCKRVEDPAWGTVNFIDTSGSVNHDERRIVFRTRPEERERLVMQLGTGEAGRALKCAEIAAKDVRGIDVNMGCPLKFSTSSGAGSALLKKPETVRDIMTTLRRNLPEDIHVTCKIRLLATIEETIDLARTIEACGVSAIGVHGRYVSQKPREPAHRDLIKQIVESVSCPIIANGDVFEYGDFQKMREQTGAAAAMSGRGAMWNQSVFRKEGLLSKRENLKTLMTRCLEWGHHFRNTKYLAREILIHDTGIENPEGYALNKANTLGDIAALFDIPPESEGRNRRSLLKRPLEGDVAS